MSATHLLTAAEAAAREIEKAAADLGISYAAAQTFYGVGIEILVKGEWIEAGDLGESSAVEAVRLFDCDGERGDICRTVAQIEDERDKWIAVLESSDSESEDD